MPSAQTSTLDSALPTHLHFETETCPACGQDIPTDKLAEIKGKIAVSERERTIRITTQLEKEYETKRQQWDASARAALESEQRQAAVREARIREEARTSSEKARQELTTVWQQKIVEADSARNLAELARKGLQGELEQVRQANAASIDAIKAEAKVREVEIRNAAKHEAESTAAERITAAEAARRESETALQAKITEVEVAAIAAKENETALRVQLEQLRNAGEAEVAKVKENAAAEATRIRQIENEKAELRYHDTLAAKEKLIAEANSKAREAEKHALEIEQNLKIQREALEQDKEDALNAEKAKAFEENQKLSNQVNNLQRALDQKTNEELGEGAEVKIFEALKAEFKDDRIERIPRGSAGADVRHVVVLRGQDCGTILYDSKNHKQWREEHADKLRRDQLAEKAEHAILSTHKFPRNARQLDQRDGVILANPARVVSVATIIRQHLLQLHTLRLSKVEREKKSAALYEFIISEPCKQLLDRIEQRGDVLLDLQVKEMKWHKKQWNDQGTAIRAIQKAKADLTSEIDSIIGTSADDTDISEAS